MLRLIAPLLGLALAACGGSAAPAPSSPAPVTATPAGDPTCPVEVPGTAVAVEDTADGAALAFVTTGDPAAVRQRAQALVDAHNAHHAAMEPGGNAAPAAAGSSPTMTMGTMIRAHSTAAVTEIDGGARVAFTAHDPAALQGELRMHAQHLASGSCRM